VKTSIFIDPEDEYFHDFDDNPMRQHEYWRTFWITPDELYKSGDEWFVRVVVNSEEVDVGDPVTLKWESPNGRQQMDGIIEYSPTRELADDAWVRGDETGYAAVVRALPDTVRPIVYARVCC
jgi:hypothetical protein